MDDEQQSPRFQIGDLVRVQLNERNRTPRVGIIHDLMWHFKDARYYYFLTVAGKTVATRKVSKRYAAIDLERIDESE